MEKALTAVKSILKHGEGPVKSVKVKSGDTKVKVKFAKREALQNKYGTH